MPRPNGARRWKRGSANSVTASATRWCGATIARISPSGCSAPLRRKAAAAATAGAISAGPGGGESPRRFAPRSGFNPGPAGRFAPRGGRGPGAGTSSGIAPGPYQAASPQLATSPIMRGQRSAMSRREALILQSLINHPWLLHDHLEEVAALELAHPEANKLRAGIIAAFANDHHHSPDVEEQAEKMRADLEARGLSEILQRVERAITTSAVWARQARRGPRGRSCHLAATRCLASENARPT